MLSLYDIQSQIITDLHRNPDKAEKLLDSFIKKEKDSSNLDKHLKLILSKAKGTRIEEVLLVHFMHNSHQDIDREKWMTRLFEHYHNTQQMGAALQLIEKQMPLTKNENEQTLMVKIFIEQVLKGSHDWDSIKIFQQIMLNKPIEIHKIFFRLIKSKLNDQEMRRLFVLLAFRYMEQKNYSIAILYYKRLLINPETNGSQHALNVYRLALCEVGLNRITEARECFYHHISLESDEEICHLLRSNLGVFFLEVGDANGNVILSNLNEKVGEVAIVGKGDLLMVEGQNLIGNPEHSKLQIKHSQLEEITSQVHLLSKSNKSGNNVYVLILNEEKEVMELKLPALQPLKLNFTKMYQNVE